MTNSEGTPAIVAGWYADYEDARRLRWWDGTQWTEHVSDPAAAQYVAPQPAPVPATAQMGTVFFWILVLLPIVSIAQLLLTDYSAIANASIASESGSSSTVLALYRDPGYLLVSLLSYVVVIAAVVLAYFDWRTLKRAGVDRPFHWAWAFGSFFTLGIVYVIGRTVVVRRRSGRGLAPFWVHLVLAVAYLVVVIIKVSVLISAVMANLPTVPTS